MGYDASRGVVAMGHSPLCAAVVLRKRATTLRLDLQRGRKGLPDAEAALFDAIVGATGGNGIPVHDRGFDGEGFVGHALRSGHRAVVRAKEMSRDVFGRRRAPLRPQTRRFSWPFPSPLQKSGIRVGQRCARGQSPPLTKRRRIWYSSGVGDSLRVHV